jgi:hypothetical protein
MANHHSEESRVMIQKLEIMLDYLLGKIMVNG